MPLSIGKLNSDSSEIVKYIHPDFPVHVMKEQVSLYPDYRGISHWHDDLEFVVLFDGEMTYDVNGQRIELTTGEGLFVNSRCFHYGYSPEHRECHFICIIFSLSLLPTNDYITENFLKPLINNHAFPYQKLSPAITWQKLILDDLISLYETKEQQNRPFHVIQEFSDILDLLSQNLDSDSNLAANSDDIQSLTAMLGYVQKNYQKKLLLRDIYTAGNCCKTKCTALFQKYLSLSPISYLNNYRLEKATHMLRSTTENITEIAYECGFASTSYFCEQFHKIYKTSPKCYRNTCTTMKH